MSDVTNKRVVIYIDQAAAEDALSRLQTRADGYNNKIAKARQEQEKLLQKIKETAAAGGDVKKLEARYNELGIRINGYNKSLKETADNQQKIKQQIDSGIAPSIRQMSTYVNKLKNELNSLSQSDPGFAKKLQHYKEQNAELLKMRERISGAQQAEKSFGGVFGMVAKGVASLSIIGSATALIGGFFNGAVKEAEEANESASRFKNTLENIGRVDAFDRLAGKAEEMANRFKYLDNDDVQEVFTKLITYGKLTENQINDLTPVIINFAAKQKISLGESADIITKALEGSGKSLKAYGIDMKEGSTVTERLGIIMTELKGRVEGAGDAFGNSLKGKAAIAKQELKNLQEQVGNQLMPVLIKFYEFTSKAVTGIGLLGKAAGYMLSTGSWQTAITLIRGEGIQKQVDAENKRAANSMVDAANRQKTIEGKQKYLDSLNGQIKNLEGQIAYANLNGQVEIEKRLSARIISYKMASAELTAQLTTGDKVLGNGDPNKDPGNKEKLASIKKEIEKLMAEVSSDLSKLTQSPLDAAYQEIQTQLADRISKINEAFTSGAITAKEASAAILKVQEDALANINAQFEKLHKTLQSDDLVFQVKIDGAQLEEELLKSIGKSVDTVAKKPSIVDKVLGIFGRDNNAKDELGILRAGSGRERLALQLAQLDKQRALAVENSDKTEAQIALIEETYRQKKDELLFGYYKGKIDLIIGYAQQAIGILDTINQARNNREKVALDRELKANDAKRKSIESLARNEVITEQEKQKRLAALDASDQKKKDELEKKQLERGKRIAIIQSIINGAMGITAVLAAKPGVSDILTLGAFRAINIGFTVATTAAQVAAISGQKFEKGGISEGSRHSQGGIDMIDSQSGKKVGEMEGGEPFMILSRNTYSNNKGIIDSLLESSLHHNGAPIQPHWQTRPYRALDYSMATTSARRSRYFEDGGIISTNQSGSAAAPTVVYQSDPEMKALLSALLSKLDQPSVAVVSLKQLEDAKTLKDNILSEATFR